MILHHRSHQPVRWRVQIYTCCRW